VLASKPASRKHEWLVSRSFPSPASPPNFEPLGPGPEPEPGLVPRPRRLPWRRVTSYFYYWVGVRRSAREYARPWTVMASPWLLLPELPGLPRRPALVAFSSPACCAATMLLLSRHAAHGDSFGDHQFRCRLPLRWAGEVEGADAHFSSCLRKERLAAPGAGSCAPLRQRGANEIRRAQITPGPSIRLAPVPPPQQPGWASGPGLAAAEGGNRPMKGRLSDRHLA